MKIQIVLFLIINGFLMASAITERFPAEKTRVHEAAEIWAVFESELEKEDVNIFTVCINDGNSDLRGAVRYLEKEKKIIFLPESRLESGKNYKVTVSGKIRKTSGGNLGNDICWYFSVGRDIDYSMILKNMAEDKKESTEETLLKSIPDEVKGKFEITAVFPSGDSAEVKINQPVRIEFSQKVNPESVNRYTVILRDREKTVPGRIEISDGGKAVNFFPQNHLDFNQKYSLNISNLIASEEGLFLKEAMTTGFRTMEKPLENIVTVIRNFPLEGGLNVDPAVKVMIFFSEEIDPDSINRFTVQVKSGQKPVFTSSFLSDNRNCLIIQAENGFGLSKNVEVRLKKNIRGISGNVTGEDYTLNFTTADQLKLVEMPEIKDKKVSPSEIRLQEYSEDVIEESELKQTVTKIIPEDAYSVPRLLESVPAPDSRKNSIETPLHFRFNKPLRSETVNGFNVLLLEKNNPVPGKVEYLENEWLISFTPENVLKYDSEYVIVLTTGICDRAGNHLSETARYRFYTENPPDLDAPQIINTYPAEGQIRISTRPVLCAVFSEDIDENTLNSFTVILNDGKYNIPGTISWNPEKRELYFKPAKELPEGEWYVFALTTAIRDLSGNAIAEPQKIRFLVGDPPDRTPPAVMSVSPADGAVLNLTKPGISLRFSEKIKTGTITPFNFSLRNESGEFIPGVIEYSNLAQRVIYRLDRDLAYGKYILRCDFPVSDLYDNQSVISQESRFEIAKKDSALTVFDIYPLYGEKVSSDESLSVDFSNDINPVSLNMFTVRLTDSEGKAAPGRIEYVPALRKAWFHPQFLESGKRYTLIISRGVQDKLGRQLEKEYRVEFEVE